MSLLCLFCGKNFFRISFSRALFKKLLHFLNRLAVGRGIDASETRNAKIFEGERSKARAAPIKFFARQSTAKYIRRYFWAI
jgi:hypothetical protein